MGKKAMKRKLWRKIQVGHAKYKLFKVKDLSELGWVGLCDPSAKEILLESSLKGEELTRTVLHELRHAAQHEFGISQFLDQQAAEMDAETFATFVVSLGVKF